MSNATSKKITILCVDDEPRVLEGLKLSLHRKFNVVTATGGVDGLAVLRQGGGIAVVVSDMRMPGMDGAKFLAKACEMRPDVTRILLTGETAREAAILAVNEGQIFRFLTKPCAPDKLIAAIDAAVRQHDLVTAEKVLLQQTVLGSIRALVDILGLVNPIAFGRAGRIKRLTVELAAAAELASSWELEAAALMSQIGYVSLPLELVEKAHSGAPLNGDERLLLAESPKVTRSLLGRIPRLETVAAIVAHATGQEVDDSTTPPQVVDSARVLKTVLEFDAMTSRGESAETALASLRGRYAGDDAKLIDTLAQLQGIRGSGPEVRELRLREVEPGMILMDDLRTDLGTLLVSRGYEISPSFMDKMRNFGPGLLAERVRVQISKADVAATPKHGAARALTPAGSV